MGAKKHTGFSSVKEKAKYHAQTKGLHAHRAFGGDCHHCLTIGDTDARVATREETGQGRGMSIAPEAMVRGLVDVRERS